MDFYQRALELNDEVIRHRRTIHQLAETGFDVDQTIAYIKKELTSYGYTPIEIMKNGVVVTAGKPGKTIALRADVDALPMCEQSGLDFAATNGHAHACGHDIHAAMMLGVAKIIKEMEDSLDGCVKIYFQPAEELLQGSKKMVDAGLLENPHVDAAAMIHVDSTKDKGLYFVHKDAAATASNNFRIHIQGKGAHGAMPEMGIDPVYIGAHIVLALSELNAREIAFPKGCVLTTGHFAGGSAPNIIADEAIIEGTFRTYSSETADHLRKRIPEVVEGIAKTFRSTATVEYLATVPALQNNLEFVEKCEKYVAPLSENHFDVLVTEPVTAADDFAYVAKEVPVVMMMLGTKQEKDGQFYPLHHPKVQFDEDAFPIGVSAFVQIATEWLKENK